MYKNATVNLYVKTTTKNSEGTTITSWGDSVASFPADVQYKALSQAEYEKWGLDSSNSDIKKMFCAYNQYIAEGNRAVVVSTLSHTTETYTILGVNFWNHHTEVILEPVTGE